MLLPRVGERYRFSYPAQNRLGRPVSIEEREIIVTSILDTSAEPIDAAAVAADPLVRRGRWLVTGYDLHRQAIRSFYLDWSAPRPLKLALLVDGERIAVGEPSKPTPRSRRLLGELCRRYLVSAAGSPESRFRVVALTA